jgi:hypothetical protein
MQFRPWPWISPLLCFFAVSAMPAAQAAGASDAKGSARTTNKSLDAFGQCFVSEQRQASRAWWFVPSEDGGMFSDVGSAQNSTGYFLRVQGSGQSLRLRLEPEGAESNVDVVLRSIDHCI